MIKNSEIFHFAPMKNNRTEKTEHIQRVDTFI